ncbi:MAG: hypothetical protein DMG01_06745, partial [Acidobacteria bacterium]
EAGRPMEIEAVVGAVVELADRLGVSIPSTRAVYASVKLLGELRGIHEQRRSVLDTPERSARGSSEREGASEASGVGPREH